MVDVGQITTCIHDVGKIVGWRNSPLAPLVHHEREVLYMVVGVVGKDIEYHAAIHILAVDFGKMQFATHLQQSLITVGTRTDCSKRLRVKFSFTITVKALSDEIFITFHLIKPRRHHSDSCIYRHLIVCHFQFSRTISRITKLQNVILVILQTCNLSASHLACGIIDSHNGFGLPTASGSSHSEQRLHSDRLFRHDASILSLYKYALCQIRQRFYINFLRLASRLGNFRQKLQRPHSSLADEREFV